MQDTIDKMSRSLTDLAEEQKDLPQTVWIKRYEVKENFTANQFVVFLKPEATAIQNKVCVGKILQVVFKIFQQWDIKIRAIRILNADYLRQYRIIDDHYGIISCISRGGRDAISVDASTVLESKFANDLRSGAHVLGGHQFIEHYPEFSPFMLSALSDRIGPIKLGSGTYCTRVVEDGKVFLVLNAFNPFQLEHYTQRGRAIIAFEALSNTKWSLLRRHVVGATDPVTATEGSIRQTFLRLHTELGLPIVNVSNNGIHLSGGPLEGMIEVRRFFSEPEMGTYINLQKTCFGRMLLLKGFREDLFDALTRNPTFEIGGRRVSSFDFTEELDSEPAAERLMQPY